MEAKINSLIEKEAEHVYSREWNNEEYLIKGNKRSKLSKWKNIISSNYSDFGPMFQNEKSTDVNEYCFRMQNGKFTVYYKVAECVLEVKYQSFDSVLK